MKKFFLIYLFLTLPLSIFCGGVELFSLAGKSYIQRGVLSFGGEEIAINVYVVAEKDKTKMLLETRAGRLAKLEIDAYGNVLSCECGGFFPKSFVEKFVLRDMRLALGFTGFLSCVTLETKNDNLKSVSYDNYKMEFCDYKSANFSDKKIPHKMKISADKYELELELVRLIAKKIK